VKPNDLLFLPLGGAGEIGMNLNLYGYGSPEDAQWIMIDLGVTFADPSMPAVDVILPDPEFIVKRRDSLIAIVLRPTCMRLTACILDLPCTKRVCSTEPRGNILQARPVIKP